MIISNFRNYANFWRVFSIDLKVKAKSVHTVYLPIVLLLMNNPFKVDLTNTPASEIYYTLAMFPYPSGAGLHVGHAMNFIACDIVARFQRMQGKKVLNPMGFDSFGLPTENYAMKQGKPASEVTQENIENFIRQLGSMDLSIDRDRMFATSDPSYYKRTQWIFSKLYKAWLVYKKEQLVNRDPIDQTVLANDQILPDGTAERSGAHVIQKLHPQRFIKTTAYADKLLEDLDELDRPEETKTAQRNWIWRSEGAEITFKISGSDLSITVFTTRPDTIYGVTVLVLAPELKHFDELLHGSAKDEVLAYRKTTAGKTTVQRQQDEKEKSGVFSGLFAFHPLTGEKVPVWFADYVLPDYATGAVMFVPAHDQRDREFAHKHGLEIKQVISSTDFDNQACYTWNGTLINSDQFNGLDNQEAKKAIITHLEQQGVGSWKVTYRLRDRSVSRQRYWGSPIPIYYDENNQPQLIPEDELPVILPLDLGNYKPAGKSPLADHPIFPNYTAKNGKTYLRECDTLDTFMCSSFYFLRFIDPENTDALISKELTETVLPVDFYIWGKEHTVGHLIYARFIHKFLYDQGMVTCKEPFKKLFHQGMVLASDGRKMSKRRGNVINPDDIIKEYGSDALRMYVMFMGPLEAEKCWDDNSLKGIKRFLERCERLVDMIIDTNANLSTTMLHKTIKGITHDMQQLKYNTSISKLMILVNHFYDVKSITIQELTIFSKLLAPFTTQLSQKLREKLGNTSNIHFEQRPTYDPKLIIDTELQLPVQINGKMKGTLTITPWLDQNKVLEMIQSDPKLSAHLTQEIKKVIWVQDKIMNIIIG